MGDRREFYADQLVVGQAPASAASLPARAEIVRAEQASGADGTMNRVEFYDHGKLARVEEDTNGDGRVDKWETWTGGVLATVALDTKGTGRPSRAGRRGPPAGPIAASSMRPRAASLEWKWMRRATGRSRPSATDRPMPIQLKEKRL